MFDRTKSTVTELTGKKPSRKKKIAKRVLGTLIVAAGAVAVTTAVKAQTEHSEKAA